MIGTCPSFLVWSRRDTVSPLLQTNKQTTLINYSDETPEPKYVQKTHIDWHPQEQKQMM